MFAFLSASKRLTLTLTFDCFCLQIAIVLSYKVTVILKVFPSHYRGWSEGEYMQAFSQELKVGPPRITFLVNYLKD